MTRLPPTVKLERVTCNPNKSSVLLAVMVIVETVIESSKVKYPPVVLDPTNTFLKGKPRKRIVSPPVDENPPVEFFPENAPPLLSHPPPTTIGKLLTAFVFNVPAV